MVILLILCDLKDGTMGPFFLRILGSECGCHMIGYLPPSPRSICHYKNYVAGKTVRFLRTDAVAEKLAVNIVRTDAMLTLFALTP